VFDSSDSEFSNIRAKKDSRAAKMPGQVPVKLKNARYREAMSVQQKIAHEMARETSGAS